MARGAADVIETDVGWDFPFAGVTIDQLRVDFGLALQLGDRAEVVLETPFVMVDGPGSRIDVQPDDPASAAAVLPLLVHVTVLLARATAAGRLTIELDNGFTLTADFDPSFESWSVSFPDGRMYLAMPGGDVAVFPARR